MQKDLVVVGAGLFGSVIAAQMRTSGREVLVVDAGRREAASPAASCLMKPGWYSASFTAEQARAGLQVLDSLYGIRTLDFRMESGKKTPMYWVPPHVILAPPDLRAEVMAINARPSNVELMLERKDGGRVSLLARQVVVAAGVWSRQLVKHAGLRAGLSGRAGCAHFYYGQLEEPRMREWAPYKQMLALNIRPGRVWVSDGAAIKPENWAQHEAANWARCDKEANYLPIERRVLGVRPYWHAPGGGKVPCFLEQVAANVWVATGAAKNGTIAAGWAAHELERRL